MKRLIVGFSGASGVEVLRGVEEVETHAIISNAAKRTILLETDYTVTQVETLADKLYGFNDIAASISSGSYKTMGMVIIPCAIKTLSGIANSYNENLLVRTADVTLKEKRKLVLVVRETPLHTGHLRLMTMAADMGAHILPPVPSFYHRPKTIDDIIDQTIGKIFDFLNVEHDLFRRWGDDGTDSESHDSSLKVL